MRTGKLPLQFRSQFCFLLWAEQNSLPHIHSRPDVSQLRTLSTKRRQRGSDQIHSDPFIRLSGQEAEAGCRVEALAPETNRWSLHTRSAADCIVNCSSRRRSEVNDANCQKDSFQTHKQQKINVWTTSVFTDGVKRLTVGALQQTERAKRNII